MAILHLVRAVPGRCGDHVLKLGMAMVFVALAGRSLAVEESRVLQLHEPWTVGAYTLRHRGIAGTRCVVERSPLAALTARRWRSSRDAPAGAAT